MDLNLTGKVAVVTGAGKGIGKAVTQALADEGAQVVAGSLTTDTLDGLKGVTPVAVDLSATDGPFSGGAQDGTPVSGRRPTTAPNCPRVTSNRIPPVIPYSAMPIRQ